jgi:hypothetical protein
MPLWFDEMDDSERTIFEYLQNQDLGPVVYEPDGNVPPDFLVNGRIAVEVRRLNENVETSTGHRGLEEISKPLNALVRKALATLGPPVSGTSWFVSYTYSRPLPAWRELDALLRRALDHVRDQSNLQGHEIRVANRMRLHFTRASKVHPHLFILGGFADHDSGGFVVAELAQNLRVCIDEKSAKVSKVKHRYTEWWLAFEDRIGHGVLDKEDQEQLRQLIRRDGPLEQDHLGESLESLDGLRVVISPIKSMWRPNIGLEPSRQRSCAIMSPRRAAQAAR